MGNTKTEKHCKSELLCKMITGPDSARIRAELKQHQQTYSHIHPGPTQAHRLQYDLECSFSTMLISTIFSLDPGWIFSASIWAEKFQPESGLKIYCWDPG